MTELVLTQEDNNNGDVNMEDGTAEEEKECTHPNRTNNQVNNSEKRVDLKKERDKKNDSDKGDSNKRNQNKESSELGLGPLESAQHSL